MNMQDSHFSISILAVTLWLFGSGSVNAQPVTTNQQLSFSISGVSGESIYETFSHSEGRSSYNTISNRDTAVAEFHVSYNETLTEGSCVKFRHGDTVFVDCKSGYYSQSRYTGDSNAVGYRIIFDSVSHVVHLIEVWKHDAYITNRDVTGQSYDTIRLAGDLPAIISAGPSGDLSFQITTKSADLATDLTGIVYSSGDTGRTLVFNGDSSYSYRTKRSGLTSLLVSDTAALSFSVTSMDLAVEANPRTSSAFAIPNPSNYSVSLVFPERGKQDFHVVDQIGRKVFNGVTNEAGIVTWEVSKLPCGIYYAIGSHYTIPFTISR